MPGCHDGVVTIVRAMARTWCLNIVMPNPNPNPNPIWCLEIVMRRDSDFGPGVRDVHVRVHLISISVHSHRISISPTLRPARRNKEEHIPATCLPKVLIR